MISRLPTILLLCSALVAACAGPPVRPIDDRPVDIATNPYGAFPGAPEQPRDVRPLNARITHRDALNPELAAFLDRLTAAVEGGNWGAVALFLEEEALSEQMRLLAEAGMSPRRAAAETMASALGFDTALGPLFPPGADRDAAPFAGLDRVGNMTVQRVEADPVAGVTWATGYIRLDDRSTPAFTLAVRPSTRGPRVVVPRG